VIGTILNDDAPPPFAFTAITRQSDALNLTFETSVGCVYCVERSQTLQPGDWTIVADQITGTGGLVTIVDSNLASIDRAFYRVRRIVP
jgi:hypothetical protein